MKCKLDCEHLNTTLIVSPYVIVCNDCGQQWNEQEWTDYKLNMSYYNEVLENQVTDWRN